MCCCMRIPIFFALYWETLLRRHLSGVEIETRIFLLLQNTKFRNIPEGWSSTWLRNCIVK